jgi:DNA-binding winged helix-turn-helix (wHTH) protein/Tfp pilus assembly protein PilF
MSERRTDQVDLASTPDFDLGGLKIHPATREISKAAYREVLQPRVMQVLIALAQNSGDVVSHERLFARCWEGRIVGDDSLHRVMAKVRRIGEAQGAFAIQTIAKVGYRLTVAGEAETPVEVGSPRHRPRGGWPAAAGLVRAAGLGVAAWAWWPAPTVRVAVQAFAATSGDPQAAAVAARVRDQIVSTLSARQVNVSSNGMPPRSARLMIGGMVEETGGTARIRVHVDDPRSNVVLWSRVFQGSSEPEGPLAEQTAAKVTDIVGGGVDVLRSGGGRVSSEALKSWMLGLDAWRQGQVLETREFYRSFKEGAPKLAVAQARFALATAQALPYVPQETAKAWRQEADRAVDRALDLDPHEAVAYYARYLQQRPLDYAGREAVLLKAAQMAPADASLNVNHGIFLTEVGRPTEGMAYIRRGFALDPLSPPKSFGIAVNLAGVGLVDEARSNLRRARRIWPGTAQEREVSEFFAVEYADAAEGRSILRELANTFPEFSTRALIWTAYFDSLECRCGVPATAKTIVEAAGRQTIDVDLAIAALLRLGDTDHAFEIANTRLPTGRARGSNFLFSAVVSPLRQERRFMDLAERLGLAAYWRTTGRWPEFCSQPGLPYDCKTEAARTASASRRGRA